MSCYDKVYSYCRGIQETIVMAVKFTAITKMIFAGREVRIEKNCPKSRKQDRGHSFYQYGHVRLFLKLFKDRRSIHSHFQKGRSLVRLFKFYEKKLRKKFFNEEKVMNL